MKKAMDTVLVVVLSVIVMFGCSFVMKGKENRGKNGTPNKKYEVRIPEEKYCGAELDMADRHLAGVFNRSALDVEPKSAFNWFLSLVAAFNKPLEGNLTDNEEIVRMQDFFELLDDNVKKGKNHPNAVFLGRITDENQMQMMWYVHDPEKVNKYLQKLIKSDKSPFAFNFQMYKDSYWKEAQYWLNDVVSPSDTVIPRTDSQE